jgi:hypothetical protein
MTKDITIEQFNIIIEKLKKEVNQEDLERFINRPHR